jgi:hypothetical protein
MMGFGGAVILASARALIALLIAISLTFTPLTGAWAKHAMRAGAGVAAAANLAPDCHKAKPHHGAPAGHDCCDRDSKSKCPDEGCGCILKCGAQTLAVFAMPEPIQLASAGEFHALDAERPPGLRLDPPGPPPRA